MDTSVAARFGEDEREFLRIRTDEVLGRIAEDLNCLAREGIAEAKGAKRAAQRAEEIYRGKDLDLDDDEPDEPFLTRLASAAEEMERDGIPAPFLSDEQHIKEQSFGYDLRDDWWPEAFSLLKECQLHGLCGKGDVEEFHECRHDARESATVFRRVVAAVFPETPGEGGGITPPNGSKHPWGDDAPDTPFPPSKLADRVGIPSSDEKTRDALRKRLEAWRKSNFDGGWIEITDRKPREPGHLYPIGPVWPVIEDMKPSG